MQRRTQNNILFCMMSYPWDSYANNTLTLPMPMNKLWSTYLLPLSAHHHGMIKMLFNKVMKGIQFHYWTERDLERCQTAS